MSPDAIAPEMCPRRDAKGVCGVVRTQTGGLEVLPSRDVCQRCTMNTDTPTTGRFNRETTLLALEALKQYGHPTRHAAAEDAWSDYLLETEPEEKRLGLNNGSFQPQGPGTCLHEALAAWGFKERDDCDCVNYATEMNMKGNKWCRNHIPRIIGWMRKSAKQRKLPFSKLIARQFVMKAIRRSETMTNLRSTFDAIYCVNLARRPDRWKSFMEGVPDDWPFREVQRVNAIDGKKVPVPNWWSQGGGAWGCFRTHLRLIENALNEGINSILLLEDDAVFNANFSTDVAEFMTQVPDDWGMLYFGGQHLYVNQQPPKEVCPGVFRPFNVNRTHAFALRGETMAKVYQHISRIDWHKGNHIDHHLGRFHQRREDPIYCPPEWLVGQAEGKSNISGRDLPQKFWPAAEDIAAIDPTNHKFVLCMGLHSSGSSCLAGVMYHMGLHMGNEFCGFYGKDPASKNCGFEAVGLRDIAEKALPFPATEYAMKRNQIWRSVRGFVNQKRREAASIDTVAGAKYPQASALGRQFHNICGEQLRILVSERPFEESVASMVKRMPKRPKKDIVDHQQFLLDKREETIANLDSIQVHRVNYHELLADPESEARAIAQWLDIELTDAHVAAVKGWVQPEKRHIRLETSDE